MCCMLLVNVGWAGAVWGLPFLNVFAPSERYYREQLGRRHQRLTERDWQAIHLIKRWLPERTVSFVADNSFAVLELLAVVSTPPSARLITRLRLRVRIDWYGEKNRDIEISSETAVWYKSGSVPAPIPWVLIRDPLGIFESQALLSTDLNHRPEQVVEHFIRR
ncbi:MAG: hypothetical protein KIT57_03460 [Blastocatellales bacterium]|nr:hypothetical protein [Blastocatellales bacterium]